MDVKTRKILIVVCVIAFLLTSTFTWGVISAGIDVSQSVAQIGVNVAQSGVDATQSGVEKARAATRWTVAWTLAHANLLVPVFFLGAIVWLGMQKTKA